MPVDKLKIISGLEKVLAELKLDGADELYYPVEDIKTIVRQYRKVKKINRSDFARIIGISPGCLKAIEAGRTGVRLDNLQKVLNAIGKRIYIK